MTVGGLDEVGFGVRVGVNVDAAAVPVGVFEDMIVGVGEYVGVRAA